MSELEEFKDLRVLGKEELTKLNLPKELVSYLSESYHYKGKLYEPIIKEVEDLYTYYTLFYDFSPIEFSKSALVAVSRANNVEKFRFYIKKIMDERIELIPKDAADITLHMSQSRLDSIIEGIKKNYIDAVNEMYEEKEVDLYEVGRVFAQLEFVLELVHDEFLSDLLKYGIKVFESYRQEWGDKGNLAVTDSRIGSSQTE
ncbi:hypothetical protein F3157_22460 [Virgibacillus dakarensis]|uniref:hypothetical protein n=1 Tax=Virgibacillus dakarensis TaxID=1917889 RepID=UPI000B43ECE9|nr:hypothetical protein [Virgibacillus dakarensis]MTW88340.1 hypothetical protein [Virgibacillus dakarensis]